MKKNKKISKNFWIKSFFILCSLFITQNAFADQKLNASKKVNEFVYIINKYIETQDKVVKSKNSNDLKSFVDLEFMAKATTGKYWKKTTDLEKKKFRVELFRKFFNFINVHVENLKEIKFNEKSVKTRGPKLIYIDGEIDTKKFKKVKVTWKLSSKTLKILDIDIEKISLVKSLRLEIKELLRKHRGDFSKFMSLYFKHKE